MPAREKRYYHKERKKRKPVHFIFHSHGKDDKYAFTEPPSDTKLHMVEVAGGVSKRGNKPFRLNKTLSNQAPVPATQMNYLNEHYFSKGKKVMAGETGNRWQRLWLSLLTHAEIWNESGVKVGRPNLEKFLGMLVSAARTTNYRERLIAANIIKEINKGNIPLEARYGTSHSTLSSILRKKGIESSREMEESLYSPFEALARKLGVGVKMKDVSEKEKELAYIDFVSQAQLLKRYKRIPAWPNPMMLESIMQVLISNLRIEQRKQLIQNPNFENLLEMNGLPKNSSIAEIEAFARRNSVFLRRIQAHKEH